MKYKEEFPDFDTELFCPEGFSDKSWHNDTMPHVEKEITSQNDGNAIAILIWQNYLDPSKRECFEQSRYIFQLMINKDPFIEYETDDLNMIKKLINDIGEIIYILKN